MTDLEYEKKIAHAAGITVMDFRARGGRVVRCDCRGPLCRDGWDVVFVGEGADGGATKSPGQGGRTR